MLDGAEAALVKGGVARRRAVDRGRGDGEREGRARGAVRDDGRCGDGEGELGFGGAKHIEGLWWIVWREELDDVVLRWTAESENLINWAR